MGGGFRFQVSGVGVQVSGVGFRLQAKAGRPETWHLAPET